MKGTEQMKDARREVLERFFEDDCKDNRRTMRTIKGNNFTMYVIVLDCNTCAYITNDVWLIGDIDDIERVWKSFK